MKSSLSLINYMAEVKEHSNRVASLCRKICFKMRLEEKLTEEVVVAAKLHDIGKKYISTKILNKPDKLTDEEMRHMKLHPIFGALELQKKGYSASIVLYVLFHHENYNSTGYPIGTGGKIIPLGSKIIRVADVYDALVSERVYRKSTFDRIGAIREMEDMKEKLDPDVFKAFLELFKNNEV